jgi:hypothetical protein
MNVGRGLFRAWIVISVLWIGGAGVMAYMFLWPDMVGGGFQPSASKGLAKLPLWATDFSKPLYERMRSPSAEKLEVAFHSVDWRQRIDWEKDPSMITVEMPDGSRLYMDAAYNDADKNYIAQQFWDQRWTRRGYAAGIIALWAFVPCALIFIIGYALLWVGRGFTRA